MLNIYRFEAYTMKGIFRTLGDGSTSLQFVQKLQLLFIPFRVFYASKLVHLTK